MLIPGFFLGIPHLLPAWLQLAAGWHQGLLPLPSSSSSSSSQAWHLLESFLELPELFHLGLRGGKGHRETSHGLKHLPAGTATPCLFGTGTFERKYVFYTFESWRKSTTSYDKPRFPFGFPICQSCLLFYCTFTLSCCTDLFH